jgi:hypothetical protein
MTIVAGGRAIPSLRIATLRNASRVSNPVRAFGICAGLGMPTPATLTARAW